jgi:predicted Zn-dependent protease
MGPRSYASATSVVARLAHVPIRCASSLQGYAALPPQGEAGTTKLTRREWSRGLLAPLAMLAGGCVTLSPSEERRLGQDEAQEVEETVGLVQDPSLLDYVRQVAGRLTQAAETPGVAWRFNGADDAEPIQSQPPWKPARRSPATT